MAKRRNFNTARYSNWRLNVYKRDGFCCRWPKCNKNRGLNAHHIKRWADSPELRFNIKNGITLCRKHHKLVTGREVYYAQFLSGLLKGK